MIRTLAASLLVFAAVPVAAAPVPTIADPAFARSLAAGYKALMNCSGFATRERPYGPRSIDAMELTGIYPELEPLLPEVRTEVTWRSDAMPVLVSARYGKDGPIMYAVHRAGKGCTLAPPDTRFEDLPRIFPDMAAIEKTNLFIFPPEQPGIGPFRLEPLKRAMGDGYGEKTRTTAVVVAQQGKVVDMGYASGYSASTPQRTWSVAKSIAATLIGAAVQRGETATGKSAGLGEDSADPLRTITIDNLLRMASGRTSETPGNRTDALYFGGYTVDETALGGPLVAKPGTVFRYANNDTLAAVKAIAPTFADHPPAELFRTLGMTDTIAETDWKGNYVLSSQVWSSALDLTRLGQLYLNGGKLKGKRVLPKEWLDYVSKPSGPQPEGEFGYGAGFWLFNKSAGIPGDTIAMMGNRGQYIVIVPSRDIVIVRRGEDPTGARFDIAGFTRDVLAALTR